MDILKKTVIQNLGNERIYFYGFLSINYDRRPFLEIDILLSCCSSILVQHIFCGERIDVFFLLFIKISSHFDWVQKIYSGFAPLTPYQVMLMKDSLRQPHTRNRPFLETSLLD